MILYISTFHAATAAKSLQSCPTLRPHRWQPTRLPHRWDSPGKSTGVGCHFLLQCMKMKSESEVAQSCPTLCDPMKHSTPGLPVHHQFLESTQTHVHCVSDAIQPSHPLSSPSPALNLSQHQGLLNESALRNRWSKYWGFSFNTSPSYEHTGLISFRMDRFDLLAVQGTLKSLLQYCSSKATILGRSAFFTVQLSHPYMTTGKTIALTRRTLVSKVMSLLLNMLSRLVMPFLPKNRYMYN